MRRHFCHAGCGLALLVFFSLLLLHPASLTAQQPYRVLDRWKIGGEGGWDDLRVDSATHRLFISRGARFDVVDLASGKLIGSIHDLHHTHSIAFDPESQRGFLTDGTGGNVVVVIDRVTLATEARIPAGNNPDLILYEPATKTVWAFNGRSHDATVIDAASLKVLSTVALPGKPEFSAADGKGTIFVNIEDKNVLVRLDAVTRVITATWPLKSCESPSGLGFDAARSRLFSVCDGKKMAITDAISGKSLGTAAIGVGPDGAAYSERYHLAFSSNGEGTLSVVDAAAPGYPTIETLPTQKSARTMAWDPENDRIYTVAAESGPRPAATAENPKPAVPMISGSFVVIVVGR